MATSERTAVITGAGRGIGRALVDVLLNRGYKVVAAVRATSDIPQLAAVDKRVLPVQCDVTKPEAEHVLRTFLEKNVDHVDLLINNAGYGATAYGIEGLNYEELDATLAVHCYGPIRCVRATLPFLRKSQDAAIVNISSRFGSLEWVAQKVVPADQATYAYRIAKAALNMLTSCLSAELSNENIRVLSIDPGKVKTRFGPRDADVEPSHAAEAIAQTVENNTHTATFVHAVSGERVPW